MTHMAKKKKGDTPADGGYFNKKRGKKNADKA